MKKNLIYEAIKNIPSVISPYYFLDNLFRLPFFISTYVKACLIINHLNTEDTT